MVNPARPSGQFTGPRESLLALALTVPLTVIYVILVVLSGGTATTLAWFPVACVLLLALSSFEFALALVVVSLFVNVHVWGFNSAVWSVLPLGAAFLLKYTDFEWRELANPLTFPILVYGACILPSFLNASQPLTCLVMLLNAAAFTIVLHVLVVGLRSHGDIRRLTGLYLGMALLNTAHVIVLYLSGVPRPFGFAGLMFVDLSAFSVCLAATMSIVSRGRQRIGLLVLSLVLTVGLVLTQTRNTWLSAIITLAFLGLYVAVHPEVAGFSRRRMISTAIVGSALIAGMVFLVLLLNPKIADRATEFSSKPAISFNESGNPENSLGTRLMIWDTALNAFMAHPIAGIGVYSFPYVSRQYYTIPRVLYEEFVDERTPHQTHLAVLTETGLIGFAGFLFFLTSAVRRAFTSITLARGEDGKRYALVAAIAVVYCTVSMLFTDAWLWGQLIVMLGMVLGVMLAIRKIDTVSEPGKAVMPR
jgi:O-antigen ligase